MLIVSSWFIRLVDEKAKNQMLYYFQAPLLICDFFGVNTEPFQHPLP